MKNTAFKKSKVFVIVEILEYVPNSVVIKTIVRKNTGSIEALAFDTNETLTRRVSPFDNFVQIVDGKAEIIIDNISHLLQAGESIIIPAHAKNVIKANIKFKMLSTIIKSGYEDISL